MAEEYEQLELTEQGQGISSPPPSERQVRASGGEHSLLPNTRVTMDTKTSLQPDVFAARALQEVSRRSMPQAGRKWNEELPHGVHRETIFV